MLRGIILILALLNAPSPEEAIQETWTALQDGSPSTFLATLTNTCSDNILQMCQEYLNTMQTMTNEELGELFASLRLEAAPNEIEFWNSTAVLEMIISSPGQQWILANSSVTIDSIQTAQTTAKAYIAITIPGLEPTSIELPLVASPLGWHTAGLEDITEILLENTISN